MAENQEVTSKNSNRTNPVYNSELNTANKRAISVTLQTSFDNIKKEHPLYKEPISFYGRLVKYSGHKGLTEQDVIRYAVSTLLDKVGY